MNAQNSQAARLLAVPYQYKVPVFQRPYSWTVQECRDLLQDITALTMAGSARTHFIGSVVYFPEQVGGSGGVVVARLIDGQQRLTTVVLLLAAIRNRARLAGEAAVEERAKNMLVHPWLTGDTRYKVLLSSPDDETLRSLLDDLPPPLSPSQRVQENFEFLDGALSEVDDLGSLLDALQRLNVVEIILEAQDDPQLIYESLNSKGLELSQADLARNLVLLRKSDAEQRETYLRYWRPMEQAFEGLPPDTFDRFLRDFLSLRRPGKPVKLGAVYGEFKRFFLGEPDANAMLAELHGLAQDYAALVLAKLPQAPHATEALRALRALDVDAARPLLLQAVSDWRRGRIAEADLAGLVRLVESFLLRRAVCGLNSAPLNQLFPELARALAALPGDADYVFECEQRMVYWPVSGRFPTDDEFQVALTSSPLYRRRGKLALMVLTGLENQDHKEPINPSNYTIEHVLPQDPRLSPAWREMLGEEWKSIQEKYLHTLGNLTLTGYNSEMGNRSFQDKLSMKGGFRESHLCLNHDLSELPTWDAEQIEVRARRLSERALKVWPRPCPLPERAPTVGGFELLLPTEELREFYQGLREALLSSKPESRTTEWPKCVTFRIKQQCYCSVRFDPARSETLNLWLPVKAEVARRVLPEPTLPIQRSGRGILCSATADAALPEILELVGAAVRSLEETAAGQ